MADCSNKLKEFENRISLLPSERKFLRNARNAITNKIKEYCRDRKHIPQFEFKVQGSFTMDTIIRPLEGEFDIDIGVYFKFNSNDRNEWPLPQTVSGWLVEALNNHTTTTPLNKITCVRIKYKSSSPDKEFAYHVDLPIYGSFEDGWGDRYTVIGMNDERKWNEKSDPLAFTKWFDKKCAENGSDRDQLVRLVKYLKAWKDFQSTDIKMPSGMVLTVIAAKNYYPRERDDKALYKLLYEVHFLLWWWFEVIKPVQPKNDLVSHFSDTQREFFMERLREFRDDAYRAIHSESQEEAIKLWQKHLGQRFQ